MNSADLTITHFVPPWPHVLAEKLGLYADQGISVHSRATGSSVEQLTQLGDRTVDLAVTAIDNVIVWNDSGANAAVVAIAEETTPLTLVARGSFGSTADLTGATLAVDSPTNGFVVVLRRMLADAGVRDFTFVETGGVRSRLDALLDGTVDATLLGPPFDGIATAQGMVILEDFAAKHPEFPGQGVVVGRSRLAELDEPLRAMLRAWASAIAWVRTADDSRIAEVVAPMPAVRVRAALPLSIVPDPARLTMLVEMRAALGILPHAFPGVASLIEPQSAQAAEVRP